MRKHKVLFLTIYMVLITSVHADMLETYNNSRYGFSFEYPVNFRIDENPFSIKIISEDSDNYRLTIRVEDLNPHLKKKSYYFSFNKFKACVSDVIRDWCFREGPIGKDDDLWGEVYCTTIAREYNYKNKYGVEVYEFYYNEVTKIRNNEKKAKITGPVFAIDISKKKQIALLFGFPPGQSFNKNQVDFMRKVIDTIKLKN